MSGGASLGADGLRARGLRRAFADLRRLWLGGVLLLVTPAMAADPGKVERPRTTRGAGSAPAKGADPAELLEVRKAIPDALVDLRYATPDNFVGEVLYPAGARCLLRRDTLERLIDAADRLRSKGYRIKLWDCYRPRSVQWKMWEKFPKPGYVANPRRGSNHNRGAAVDLTLTTLDGREVEMPTPYDSFERAAHQGYTGGTLEAREHRKLLRSAMESAGFGINRSEWWHYDAPGALKLPVRDEPLVAVEDGG